MVVRKSEMMLCVACATCCEWIGGLAFGGGFFAEKKRRREET